MNRRTRTVIDDLLCYMIITLAFTYLVIHVVYAFVREDSGFKNPDLFLYQTQQQINYSNSLEYEKYYDEAGAFMSEKGLEQ